MTCYILRHTEERQLCCVAVAADEMRLTSVCCLINLEHFILYLVDDKITFVYVLLLI